MFITARRGRNWSFYRSNHQMVPDNLWRSPSFVGGYLHVRSYRLTNSDQIRQASVAEEYVFGRSAMVVTPRCGAQRSQILSGPCTLYLCQHHLTQNDQVRHGDTFKEDITFRVNVSAAKRGEKPAPLIFGTPTHAFLLITRSTPVSQYL